MSSVVASAEVTGIELPLADEVIEWRSQLLHCMSPLMAHSVNSDSYLEWSLSEA
jgi:hypothetical protein